MHLAMKIVPFFFFWYLFNILPNKDFKKLSSKCYVKEYCYRFETNAKISLFTYLLERPPFLAPEKMHFACEFF